MTRRAAWLLALVVLAGCGTSEPAAESAPPSSPTTSPTTSPTPDRTSPTRSAPTATPTPSPQPRRRTEPEPRPRAPLGIDVSHYQGEIDWPRVADDGIAFAYLKATEGSTFTDPRFAANHADADAAGLRVGGYHYYTLCSPPEGQADHFTATLDAVPAAARPLPPVVDLELIGNCDPPPDLDTLLADVRVFVARVEAATGRRVVVYTHPDLDDRYGPATFAERLDRRHWVRRPGDRPPPRGLVALAALGRRHRRRRERPGRPRRDAAAADDVLTAGPATGRRPLLDNRADRDEGGEVP